MSYSRAKIRDKIFVNPTAKVITHEMFSAQQERIELLGAALEQIAYSDFSADVARAKARAALAKVAP